MLEDSVKLFKAQLEKLRVYNHAMGVMQYDMETVMPSGAAALVGDTLGALSEAVYLLQTDAAFVEATKAILSQPDAVDAVTLCEAKRMDEARERVACIPMEDYIAKQIEDTAASTA